MKFLHLSLFKSAAVLLIVVFLSAGDLAAQTPQFYNYNNGTSYNSFPLNVAPGKMVQSLIAAGEFTQPTPATAGNITKFYLRISTGYPLGPATYTNFKILFSQASITVLPYGFFLFGNLGYSVSEGKRHTDGGGKHMAGNCARPFLCIQSRTGADCSD